VAVVSKKQVMDPQAWEELLRERGLQWMTPEESAALKERYGKLREGADAMRAYPMTQEPFSIPRPPH
jgi:hypothetical protein